VVKSVRRLDASQVRASDRRVTSGGAVGIAVFNFTVDEHHTYFVGKTSGGAWVHNRDCLEDVLNANAKTFMRRAEELAEKYASGAMRNNDGKFSCLAWAYATAETLSAKGHAAKVHLIYGPNGGPLNKAWGWHAIVVSGDKIMDTTGPSSTWHIPKTFAQLQAQFPGVNIHIPTTFDGVTDTFESLLERINSMYPGNPLGGF
jgi:hypothetical protein